MIRDAILVAIRESKGLQFKNTRAREELVDNLLDALAEELFGDGATPGEPESPSRALSDLYERCEDYTEGNCEVAALNLTGPVVELGPASYLAWEVVEGEEARPVLGYDLPEVDRYYYHQLPADARVFVFPSGALVITHPDLMLTDGGLDEPTQVVEEEFIEERQYGMDPEYDALPEE